MRIRKTLCVFFTLLFSSLLVFGGQTDSCYLQATTSPSTQRGGRYITATGTLNVLCVYVQFPDDNWLPSSSWWPKGQAPTYMKSTIDAVWSATPIQGGFTDYFNQMSFNTLKITGKVVSVITPHTRKWYLDNNKIRPDIQKEVIQQLDATIDFAEFDNWRYNFPNEYSQTNTPDSIVDMIFMMWRNIDSDTILAPPATLIRKRLGLEPGGEASLGYGNDFTVDGGARTIAMDYGYWGQGSGITAIHPVGSNLSPGVILQYARHEFGHWLLGGNEYHTQLGTWGLTDGWGTPSGCINSFEREQLAWMNFNTIDDISTTRTINNVTLPDFITTNTAYRIKVPGGGSDEYYLLENHQRISGFDVPDNNVSTAKGLFVLRQEYDQGNGTGIISAQGRFNWTVPYQSLNIYSGSGDLPVFQRGSSNRVNGYSKRQSVPWTWQGVPQTSAAIHYFLDPITGALRQAGVNGQGTIFTGDGKDQFALNYNTVFSPASNPSSDLYNDSNKIAFEITGISNGVYTLNVHINNVETASPSRPQNVSVGVYGRTRFNPGVAQVSWSANAESDIAGYEVYRSVGGPDAPTLLATVSSSPYTDYGASIGPGVMVYYRLKAKDAQGLSSTYSDAAGIESSSWQQGNGKGPDIVLVPPLPEKFELAQNYPNPFNPTTSISYALPEAGNVHLTVFDYLGRDVATLVNEYKEAGYYEANFDASRLSSGIYFYQVQVGKLSAVKKMLLMR